MSTSTEQIASRNTVVWMGILLIAALGLIHLLEAPEELEEATYLGLLFLANFGGAVVAAIGIYLNRGWGWLLGATLAGASFVGYGLSCTVLVGGYARPDCATVSRRQIS